MTAHNSQQFQGVGLARGWRGEAIALLAAALAAIVLLAAGYSRAWPLTIAIGGQDRRFIDPAPPLDPTRGFHAVEDFGGSPMRWTTGDATIAIPRPPEGTALLTLRLLNSRPAGQPDPRVALSADGRAIGTFEVARTIGGGRIYRVLVPGAAQLAWATRVNLHVDTITLSSDPRPLGVVVHQATLAPTGAPLWPSLWLLLCGAWLGALAYGLARVLGAGRAAAWGIAAGLAALLAAGIAARPLEVLPFVQRIAALLALAGLGLALARLLTSRRPTTPSTPLRAGDDPFDFAQGRRRPTTRIYSPAHPLTRSPAQEGGQWSVVGGQSVAQTCRSTWPSPGGLARCSSL